MKNGHTTRQKAPAGRYALLDELRGLDLVSMMLYHACWDMMFLFGIWMDWYAGMPGRLWQQTICWVFILLSGFCLPLGHRPLRRGLIISGAGVLVTAVTLLFMPEDRVVFGVLTLLGGGHAHHRPSAAAAAKDPGLGRAGGVAAAVCGNLPHTGWLLAAGPVADAAAGCLVCQSLHGVLRLFPAGLFLHGLLSAAALAVFVLGRVLPAFLHGAGPHGAAAPVGVPGAGLDGPALAFAVSAAPAGDLRRTFSRGSSFCIKGLTQPGSCGILSVVRMY